MPNRDAQGRFVKGSGGGGGGASFERYVPNPAGMAALAASSGVQGHLRTLAGRVLSAAQSSAPVKSGRYAASFAVRTVVTDRPVVRVYNDAPYAAGVEYGGSSNSLRHRTLGKALESA